MRPLHRVGLTIIALLGGLSAGAVGAAEQSGASDGVSSTAVGTIARASDAERPTIVGLRAGFKGVYKAGVWVPVEVRWQAGGPGRWKVGVSVPDADGCEVEYPAEASLVGAARDEQVTRLCVRCGRVRGRWRVTLYQDGQPVARREWVAGDEQMTGSLEPAIDGRALWLVIGNRDAVAEALVAHGVEPEDRPVLVEASSPDDLPVFWYGYEGVDALIVATTEPDFWRAKGTESGRWHALEQWVALGGRLIVLAGRGIAPLWGEHEILHTLLPGARFELLEIRQAGSLESYCRSSSALLPPGTVDGLSAAIFADFDGVAEIAEGKRPLLIRRGHVLGRVVFFACDIDRPPFSQWRDRAFFLARLLELPPQRGDEGTQHGTLHAGYHDLSGQLRSALDRYEEFPVIPFWAIACAATLYLALLAPWDYWLLRRRAARMGWAWATFVLIVITASGAVLWTGARMRAEGTSVRRIETIDIATTEGIARGQVWFNVYQSQAALRKITVVPPPLAPGDQEGGHAAAGKRNSIAGNQDSESANVPSEKEPSQKTRALAGLDQVNTGSGFGAGQTLVGWQGLSGRALGGMSIDAFWGDAGMSCSYSSSPQGDCLFQVPIPSRSSRAFTARWFRPAGRLIEAHLADPARHLEGRVVNLSDFIWEDCLLAYGRWGFELGRLRPGEAATIGPLSRRSELKTLLTGRRLVYDDSRDKYHQQSRPYDQTSSDAAYILRMMMFYGSAGGREYTKLALGRESWIDVDGLLQAGRAVLAVRAIDRNRGTQVRVDGSPANWATDDGVFYRFVLRVETQP